MCKQHIWCTGKYWSGECWASKSARLDRIENRLTRRRSTSQRLRSDLGANPANIQRSERGGPRAEHPAAAFWKT